MLHPQNNMTGPPEATADSDIGPHYDQIVIGAHQDGPMPCCHDAEHCWTLWFALRRAAERFDHVEYIDPASPPPWPRIPTPRLPIDRAATRPRERSGEFAGGVVVGTLAGFVGAVVVLGAALSTVIPY